MTNFKNTTRRKVVLAVVVIFQVLCLSQCEEKEVYRGKFLGKINSYHHQVSGDVYAVDEYTFLLTEFNYDGNGADTFFWAGASNRPGPQGFIVPDEYGKTNILARYFNKDFTITLPDGKKITEIKWFAIYDLTSQNAFGDLYIPEDFEPPTVQKISQLSKRSHDVGSESIEIIDAKTFRIPELNYNGAGKDTYFYVGVGPQPSSKGTKVPDEYGYLDPIRAYKRETVTLELPGDLTIFDIDWLSIYDVESKENYGSVIVPDGLNVPPSLVKIIPRKKALPNCYQLHKDLQVGWDVFGPQITIELAGQIDDDAYMSFGLSGAVDRSQMMGADIAVAYMDGFRGYATDYNVTALSPCIKVLGQHKGVCRDDLIGGLDDNQLHTAERVDGVTYITYRRMLMSADKNDREFPTEGGVYVVWALGHLDHNKEPTFHDFYARGNVRLELSRKDNYDNCFAFTKPLEKIREPWEPNLILDRTTRTFTATLGPSGGKRGYQGQTGMTSMGLSWYINGMLIPELWMRRGLTYAFRVRGGNNPHSAETYHPLIITDEPHGGFDRLSDAAQREVRVLAGVEFLRRGQPRPLAAGPLCLSRHKSKDRRLDDDFPTFKKFNRSLEFTCEPGDPAVLEVTPNTSWPDIVYYNSFTHNNMGWKIHIVDNFARGSAFTSLPSRFLLLTSIVSLGSHFI
ncbi:protein Skeletor, isoforms B/C [Frankliniella occidentalis]|uniref:Protein Skeletor, isoforms B/C n=1 Tax=Frankliniella occidentalis TaxID=133901 RepID=A0A6J1RZB1_FRAOC|nr:protein Skeletor, isoforms B/C [Frankliniella occidentalis]